MSSHALRKEFLIEFVRRLTANALVAKTQDLYKTELLPPTQIQTVQVQPTLPLQAEQQTQPEQVQEDEREEHDVRSIEMEDEEQTVQEEPTQTIDEGEYETSEEVGDQGNVQNEELVKQKNIPDKFSDLPPVPEAPRTITLKEPSKLGALEPLLFDKEVQAIECVTDKPINIMKNNQLVSVPLVFSQQELAQLIINIGELTHSALQDNILTGETDQFIVTAVTSEFAGNRLIIHKKDVA